jgi:hypothetical protein
VPSAQPAWLQAKFRDCWNEPRAQRHSQTVHVAAVGLLGLEGFSPPQPVSRNARRTTHTFFAFMDTSVGW